MKLEVGKKYVERYPSVTLNDYVEIVAFRESQLYPYFGLNQSGSMGKYQSNGRLMSGNAEPYDLVAEYVKPTLNLGPEHVGRRVRMSTGAIALIVGYEEYYEYPVRIDGERYTSDGLYESSNPSTLDIVELLP